ncbi:MAG TPA: hypothetical protein VKU87_11100, partial [Thermomicrobiaceae bacterium]|nr:hypothetical protein [Thermomicrobiaceae bacterium]
MGRLRIGTMVGLLVLALLAGLTFLPASSALADGTTYTYSSCSQASSSFPGDLSSVTGGNSATFDFPPDCTIELTSSLTVNPNVTITINGNGLTLQGNGTSTVAGTFDIIDMEGTLSSTSTLMLNAVMVEDGMTGINASGAGGGNGGTVALVDSTLSNNAGAAINADGDTGLGSPNWVQGNGGGAGGAVSLTDSTISGGTIGIDARGGNGGVGNFYG